MIQPRYNWRSLLNENKTHSAEKTPTREQSSKVEHSADLRYQDSSHASTAVISHKHPSFSHGPNSSSLSFSNSSSHYI